MANYKHILIATDLSPGSKVIYEQARTMAQLMQSKLSIVHIIEPTNSHTYGYVGAAGTEIHLADSARANLAEVGRLLGIPKTNQYVDMGSAKVEIIRMVEKIGADFIVMGSHGKHGLNRLLGSTAAAVVQNALCDILTVRFQPIKK